MLAALFSAIGLDPAVFLKAAFEVSLLLLFLVCLAHSLFAHGWRRTLREFVAGFALTAFCESLGVLSGAYVYPGFHFYVLATPVANPASWIATVYIIIEVSNRLVHGRRSLQPAAPAWSNATAGSSATVWQGAAAGQEGTAGPGLPAAPVAAVAPAPALLGGSLLWNAVALALVDAALALAVDLVMDPLATIYNWWVWVPCAPGVTAIGPGVVNPYNFDLAVFTTTPHTWVADFFAVFFPAGMRYPTRVLGVPLINFVAWFVFVFVFTLEFRWVENRPGWADAKKTAMLWLLVLVDVPVLALLLIAPNL